MLRVLEERRHRVERDTDLKPESISLCRINWERRPSQTSSLRAIPWADAPLTSTSSTAIRKHKI